jgi:hypothetical protein
MMMGGKQLFQQLNNKVFLSSIMLSKINNLFSNYDFQSEVEKNNEDSNLETIYVADFLFFI